MEIKFNKTKKPLNTNFWVYASMVFKIVLFTKIKNKLRNIILNF